MANDLNRVFLIGRLTQDPELRQTNSGSSFVRFSIANNKSYTYNGEKREEVSFFNCTAWGKLSEIIHQYCQKGKQIAIEGRLQQRSWTNQEGKKQYTIDIVVENMQLLGSSRDSVPSGGSGYGYVNGGEPQQNPGFQSPSEPPPSQSYPNQESYGGEPRRQQTQTSGLEPGGNSTDSSFVEDDIPF